VTSKKSLALAPVHAQHVHGYVQYRTEQAFQLDDDPEGRWLLPLGHK
jgi:hypothetical protein